MDITSLLGTMMGNVGQLDKGTQTFLNALKLQTLAAVVSKTLGNKKNPNMMFLTSDIDRVGQSIAGGQPPIDLSTILTLLPLLQGQQQKATPTEEVEQEDDKIYAGVLAKIKKEYKLTPRKKA